jgi:hypothetical protein
MKFVVVAAFLAMTLVSHHHGAHSAIIPDDEHPSDSPVPFTPVTDVDQRLDVFEVLFGDLRDRTAALIAMQKKGFAQIFGLFQSGEYDLLSALLDGVSILCDDIMHLFSSSDPSSDLPPGEAATGASPTRRLFEL